MSAQEGRIEHYFYEYMESRENIEITVAGSIIPHPAIWLTTLVQTTSRKTGSTNEHCDQNGRPKKACAASPLDVLQWVMVV
jgi:hypothetical protein